MNPQPSHIPPGLDRERDRDREIEEQQLRERHMRQEELAQREREHNERERQHREQQQYQSVPQHQTNTGAIPIHQPVASRLPGAIHSPGGLLANHGGSTQPGPLTTPAGPGSFGGPLHSEASRSIQQQQQQQQQQHNQQTMSQQHNQMFGPNLLNHPAASAPPHGPPNGPGAVFGGSLQPDTVAARVIQQVPFSGPMGGGHQIPGAPALAQGQQPILNDALSYLDQVKVQFVDQPDVYNRFLDIMKDFKSQAIDTPGVINRVSELFAGHPNLIQGFNTFLPPGYRIECGAGNDPNTIRVTTPMGTTVQSITGAGRALPDAQLNVNNPYYTAQRGSNWQQQPQHSVESPEAVFSPQPRSGVPAYSSGQGQASTFESQQAAAAAHQQEQRGVSQLQSAVARETGHPVQRNALTPTPGGQAMNGAGAQQPGLEKRGPVEFNHAISYVNKIKNRFQDKPEIYKQFLEILQTYQRESKPIQDVYAQVTTLFNTAPDLLEDFKQFLPESAAQAKAAAAKAAEDDAALGLAGVSQTPQPIHSARGEQKLPPVGNFPPPSASKEGKKRTRPPPTTTTTTMASLGELSNVRSSMPQPGNMNKRAKLSHTRAPLDDMPAVSPTLTPNLALPQPMPPSASTSSQQAEIAFFDKVKKFLSNKQTFAEFLKLCNLFSQDLIDRNVLVHKVSNFIGTNVELMDYFKKMVAYVGPEEVIENRPRAPTGRVALSNCRGLGPSYRLLPKRERLKSCGGRDEMCNSVLNDDWASHPTWASEDSGFVAHRKNIYEEALHRIEEERHDYDFNIEANQKVIQLLEPIGQQLLAMSTAEVANFRMPTNLGGSSPSIHKRILKKIYGPERGAEVAADLFKDPTAVLPTILARLKQKDEEWRFTQREWDKVWHAQTQSMYLKSLDHMGINVKTSDKKLFAAKNIVDHIKLKHEEQRRQRSLKSRVPRYQFAHEFKDEGVIVDAVRLSVLYVTNAGHHSGQERERIAQFFERFIPLFFDISMENVQDRVRDISRGSPDDDMEDITPAELTNGRGRRANGKKADLLRGVLDRGRNGTKGRGQKEDSAASGSKESTPDLSTLDDGDDAMEAVEDQNMVEVTNERWLATIPGPGAVEGTKRLDHAEMELKADKFFQRDYFNLYCNQTILVFFTLFELLYRRLKAIKDSEQDVIEEVRRSKYTKPAKEIGLIDDKNDFFSDDFTGDYYSRALYVMEEVISGEMDETRYQEFFRRYYLKKGWTLYTIQELLKSLCRMAALCSGSDNKDKTPDILELFADNRDKEETTYNTEINLRKQVEKYVKDGEMFLVKYYPKTHQATVQLILKDETTFELTDMERKERWKYYTSSFVRIEPTEGVHRDRVRRSVLTRNLPSGYDTDSDVSGSALQQRKPMFFSEDLVLRICVNSYQILYKSATSEYFIYKAGGDTDKAAQTTETRNQKFREKYMTSPAWMDNLSPAQVQDINQGFERWVKDGVPLPVGTRKASAALVGGGSGSGATGVVSTGEKMDTN